MDQTTITVGLAAVFVACAGGGLGCAFWLSDRFVKIKDELLEAIAQARKDGDAKTDERSDKLDELTRRQSLHELTVEQRFMSKETAGAIMTRIEGAVQQMRGDLSSLINRIADGRPANRRSPKG